MAIYPIHQLTVRDFSAGNSVITSSTVGRDVHIHSRHLVNILLTYSSISDTFSLSLLLSLQLLNVKTSNSLNFFSTSDLCFMK